ncbi:carbamoyltransferase HypF [uncultured Roseibium sp.]|uniref:carbamoyltransferase HypF n=1 Tax=uncultured Roseibium sp. TaxID=1936171 RepID=UPI00261D7F49|nr:carbamoyltransferase HypF [uncultured Roseibium sp.]
MNSHASNPGIRATRVRFTGLVQGVGFRPFVWRLAEEEGLSGKVWNDAAGVLATVIGPDDAVLRFLSRLRAEAPPLARIDDIRSEPDTAPLDKALAGFQITTSMAGEVATGIVPDAATCPACLRETLDPAGRRFRYPFTNCTHCGPRLSIVTAIPYDRANTSMAPFVMCAQCQAEYEAPADRRFHAQPIACPQCGPRVWIEQAGNEVGTTEPIKLIAQRIAKGEIVAVKGIGGFHLAVDASNDKAVDTLRARKKRPRKPMAIMARDLDQVRAYCDVSKEEADLLTSAAAPIVLLEPKQETGLASGLAPGTDRLGVMLPYTPLHHLMMSELSRPIVLTSGNLSEEPQAIENTQARKSLNQIADAYLMHDRAIMNRLDDSVVRVSRSGNAVLRRARGLAPTPIRLAEVLKQSSVPVLAMGGELKSTFCFLQNGQAIVSQHMGDLENRRTLEDFQKTLTLFRRMYDFDPQLIAIDSHSDYLSTQLGRRIAAEAGAELTEVQHHHAHFAACLAEAGVPPNDDASLAIVLDGSGLGTDKTIWGGELLVGGYRHFERVGHFQPVSLPGATAAIREPWRNLYAHLQAAFGSEEALKVCNGILNDRFTDRNLSILDRMINMGLNAPLSSSAGRMFDAVAAALGVCVERQSFEGETGLALEAMARPFASNEEGYPIDINGAEAKVFTWKSLWTALLEDLQAGVDRGRISARFHISLIDALARCSIQIAQERGMKRIVLSGGVMQNELLLDGLEERLRSKGMEVILPRELPANDGGICLGQAVIAAIKAEV